MKRWHVNRDCMPAAFVLMVVVICRIGLSLFNRCGRSTAATSTSLCDVIRGVLASTATWTVADDGSYEDTH